MVMILAVDWECPDHECYLAGNKLMDELEERFQLTGNSSGMGFGMRDMAYDLPDDIFSRSHDGWDTLEEELNDGDVQKLPEFHWQVYDDEENPG